MNDTDTMTLQEAAIAAGFEDFMLEPGGGIKSWDNSRMIGIVYSEKTVRATALFVRSKGKQGQAEMAKSMAEDRASGIGESWLRY